MRFSAVASCQTVVRILSLVTIAFCKVALFIKTPNLENVKNKRKLNWEQSELNAWQRTKYPSHSCAVSLNSVNMFVKSD